MTDHHTWDDRLSQYVDGELAPSDRGALETHLAGCERCRTIVGELRAVVAEARPLRERPVPPGDDLWPGILERIAAEEAAAPRGATVHDIRRHPWFTRRLSLSLPQVAAAAAGLVLVTGAGLWLATSRLAPRTAGPLAVAPAPLSPGNQVPPGSSAFEPGVGAADVAPGVPGDFERREPARARSTGTPAEMALAAFSDPRYDATIAQLQRVLDTGRGRLDTTTVRILEQNLAIIDRAVEEARRAVAADPANAYLRDHLASTMRRKVDLLRRVTVIAGAQG